MGWRGEVQFVTPWQTKMCLTEKKGEGVLKCYWIKFEKVCIPVFYFKSEFWVFPLFSWYSSLPWWHVCVLGWRRVYSKDTTLWWCAWLLWWIWWAHLWWIFYFCMILYLHIIPVNKHAANCTVQFSLEYHTMAFIPLYFLEVCIVQV